MRSRTSHTITSVEVHEWALKWLLAAGLLKDHGWLCTATVVWSVVLRAAARMTSPFAACRDLSDGPCGQSVFDDPAPIPGYCPHVFRAWRTTAAQSAALA